MIATVRGWRTGAAQRSCACAGDGPGRGPRSTSSKRSSATIPSPLARAVTSWPSASSRASATSRRAAPGRRDRPALCLGFVFGWLASRTLFSVSRTDQPPRAASRARRRRTSLPWAREQGLAVALAEVAGLEQLQRLVGQLEQADQVGDGGAAAADAAGQLLFGQAELARPGRRRPSPPRPGSGPRAPCSRSAPPAAARPRPGRGRPPAPSRGPPAGRRASGARRRRARSCRRGGGGRAAAGRRRWPRSRRPGRRAPRSSKLVRGCEGSA